MSSEFLPGDKVIKRTETDARNCGHVMNLSDGQMKPGYVAVYFARHVWIKPENLMHFHEWQQKNGKQVALRGSLKNYWNGQV